MPSVLPCTRLTQMRSKSSQDGDELLRSVEEAVQDDDERSAMINESLHSIEAVVLAMRNVTVGTTSRGRGVGEALMRLSACADRLEVLLNESEASAVHAELAERLNTARLDIALRVRAADE